MVQKIIFLLLNSIVFYSCTPTKTATQNTVKKYRVVAHKNNGEIIKSKVQ